MNRNSAARTLGPWEPDWVKGARLEYYARLGEFRHLIGRIGRTHSGREFLRRTGAYGQKAAAL